MSDYEELDSFTENIIKRTEERQRLLNGNRFTPKAIGQRISAKAWTNVSPEESFKLTTKVLDTRLSPEMSTKVSITRGSPEKPLKLSTTRVSPEKSAKLSITRGSPEKTLKLSTTRKSPEMSTTRVSPEKAFKMSTTRKSPEVSTTRISPEKAFKLSTTRASPEKLAKLSTTKGLPEKPLKLSTTRKSPEVSTTRATPEKSAKLSTTRVSLENSAKVLTTRASPKILAKVSTIESKNPLSGPVVSRPKSNIKSNILMRQQLISEKLFSSETTTANAYKKELENRQKEIQLLKRPFKRSESPNETLKVSQRVKQFEYDIREQEVKDEEVHECKKYKNAKEDKENNHINNDKSYESVDDETAHQTVCEAFDSIENISNGQLEDSNESIKHFNESVQDLNESIKEFNQSIDESNESIDENLNNGLDSYKSDSKLIIDKKLNIESESPTKNRLYPQLFAEPNDLCAQTYDLETDPPEKPPRIYQPMPETNTTPLRTISFYRREQSSQQNAIEKTQPFEENVSQTMNNIDLVERNHKIQEKIDEYKEKVENNNRIAGQVSQALNLCLERDEFKGSTERVEAEKVLLISGQKRMAFLNEIQRLKVKLNDTNPEPESSKGILTLSDFQLPIKGEFNVARARGTVTQIHNIICLVNTGANVLPTNLLNTEENITNGSLNFDFGFRDLSEVSADFQMAVHIYDLITTKQVMSHEVKYHIKRTPKKNKSTMKSPTVRSPGGPNAVMSTSFRLIGSVNINLKNYDKNCFRLENFEFNSSLEGTLKVKSNLTVRHPYYKEGFFDVRDNSGFWNMRWTVFSGTSLAFWRFPEDYATKPSLAVIDLKKCVNPKISLLPTHLRHNTRRNTIAMILVDNSNGSKNIFSKGGSLPRSRPIKLLISGENKANCVEWANYMSTALANTRVWDKDSAKPYSDEEYEKLLMNLQ